MVEHKLIKASLLAFKKVMDKHGIPFWLEYGTQLGAVREGRIIPWDLDGDVGVWCKHVQKMKDAVEDFKAEGLLLYYQPSHIFVNYKINEDTWQMTLDCYTFKRIRFKGKDWIVRYENGLPYHVRAPAAYYESFIFVDFIGARFMIPILAKKALEFAYGPYWRTPIKLVPAAFQLAHPTPAQRNAVGRSGHRQLEDL